ncbi:DUF2381 family protein [Hyalangium rubrum]|uniref:DUF2381 family protein n=1 Tax=Hyalangium rubrum TaxID=3103134 RepID=A0ABU5HHD0_9BACT|nr:DUF2381 family protein [Hyalangium sp. s54d21]MDY7232243.1 DUF2381 family protein [Hyalangium sp. s54d21]
MMPCPEQGAEARLRALVLLSLLLLAGVAHAQSDSSSVGKRVRHIQLKADGSEVPTVFIQPGRSTLLLFNVPLEKDGVELEARESFQGAEIGERSVFLLLGTGLPVGRRLRLVVRFSDDLVPRSAEFLLEVSSSQGERQVEIHRLPFFCEGEGLLGLLAAGELDVLGIDGLDLRSVLRVEKGAEVRVEAALSFRARKRIALRLELQAEGGAAAWKAGGAVLRASPPLQLQMVEVQTPSSPERSILLLEVEAGRGQLQERYHLDLLEADGGRTLTLANVVFP